MAYNNDTEYEAGAPKKADVLIRSTQHIALKQDEMNEQTKKVATRLEEAIDLFSKNSQDATYVVKQSGEIFDRLQTENSALKQEMLYLAKQSENIYAGLAEKITELSEQSKNSDGALSGFADKVNDVAELSRRSEEAYAQIADKIAELTEKSKQSENAFAAIADKLEAISNKLDAVSDLAVRREPVERTVVERVEPVRIDNSEVLDKLNYLTEQMRKNEGAHTTLADKLEILSMRVEQFGMESAKGNAAAYSRTAVAPVAITTPAQSVDYDKLAEKVASLISTREVISPDYIAAKVAEQIVLPEIEAANVKLSVDTHEIARQTAELINANSGVRELSSQTVNARIDLNEDEIADKIVQKLGAVNGEIASASAIDIDEEQLAQRLANKLGGLRVSGGVANLNIDEEELADRIALKVGSLRSEDFEILVDDEGCTSISKEIADNLDYAAISNTVADKLREALDLAAANAPDYEDMAERISEKITVAGINEDAIADKAAAVLSNYLPEFDTDEIADKITGAVIDVVSAIPQPTIDSEAICNNISERLIESQEDHDYDIVIDDDGIAKITELVTEEMTKNTDERFSKVEEEIHKLTELLTAEEEIEEDGEYEEETEEEYDAEAEEEYSEEYFEKLTSLMAAEIEKGTSSRFDKVEEDIAKLTELVNNTVSEEEYEETEELADDVEADYSRLSEVVAAEIEKGVTTRFDKVEEDIAKLTELISSEEEAEYEEEYEEYPAETDYSKLSEVVAAEIEKNVTSRLDGMQDDIAKITELVTANEEPVVVNGDGEVEIDYTRLSDIVAVEIEKGLSTRLDSVEENIAKITEIVSAEEEPEQTEQTEQVEEDYSKLSEVIAAEIEKGIAYRLDIVEENIAKITETIASGDEDYEEEYDAEAEAAEEEEYYAKLSDAVATEVEKRVSSRFDSVEENIAKITEIVSVDDGVQVIGENGEAAMAEVDYDKLSGVVAEEIEKGVTARLDRMQENVDRITEIVTADDGEYDEEDEKAYEEAAAEEEAEYYAKLSEVVASEIEKGVTARLDRMQENVDRITEIVTADDGEYDEEDEKAYEEAAAEEESEYYAKLSEVVASEIEKGVASRLDKMEENVANLSDYVKSVPNSEVVATAAQEDYSRLSEVVAYEIEKGMGDRFNRVDNDIARVKELVNDTHGTNARFDKIEDDIAKISALVLGSNVNNSRFDKIEDDIAKLSEQIKEGIYTSTDGDKARYENFEDELAQIKDMLASGIIAANAARDEAAAAHAAAATVVVEEVEEQPEEVVEEVAEEEPIVTVSEVVEPEPIPEPVEDEAGKEEEEFEEDEEEPDDDDDLLIDVLDMDAFSDDELMPGDLSELEGGVDFANMMKFKRSFIARIIQSNDDYKQYYGEVKHALISYKKVNSNVAWGAERFNKGRETIARLKIRGKTLCLYLALDPNNYKTSVYHHIDVSDNKSVAGTPMMVKVKSNLGVRKAIRLIDEMLAMRNGEKKEIPERDYAAMYPYETIEELIEEGLVKDVRKNK